MKKRFFTRLGQTNHTGKSFLKNSSHSCCASGTRIFAPKSRSRGSHDPRRLDKNLNRQPKWPLFCGSRSSNRFRTKPKIGPQNSQTPELDLKSKVPISHLPKPSNGTTSRYPEGAFHTLLGASGLASVHCTNPCYAFVQVTAKAPARQSGKHRTRQTSQLTT